MNEQINKDRLLLEKYNSCQMDAAMEIGGQIITTQSLLEAQERVTQYEERTRAVEIVELLQARIADQEPYIQLDTSTRMVVQSELDGIRDSVLYPPTL